MRWNNTNRLLLMHCVGGALVAPRGEASSPPTLQKWVKAKGDWYQVPRLGLLRALRDLGVNASGVRCKSLSAEVCGRNFTIISGSELVLPAHVRFDRHSDCSNRAVSNQVVATP